MTKDFVSSHVPALLLRAASEGLPKGAPGSEGMMVADPEQSLLGGGTHSLRRSDCSLIALWF